ncbi:hypothetical protein OV079_02420 [Nannocystis pusilla]|uniref:Uncharacterized protein n=1 Tax=Nannocystis pusilla TaxID=889268 RepID=A0A9X3EJQ0_9BACT|nr:hypothetical protein [Nannocystis pusilla]MCY1004440.1 hypothetical protein [Nannocystis pusilla]
MVRVARVDGRGRRGGPLPGAEPVSFRQLLRDLWYAVLSFYPIEEVEGEPDDLRISEGVIFGRKGAEFVLERVTEGERASLRRIRIHRGEYDEETETYRIEEPTDRLRPGGKVHTRIGDEPFLVELYQKLGTFYSDLERAPMILQDVRTLLYWTAVMLDAPLCQGDVKARTSAAFEQAKAYYDTARRQLMEGRSVDAVRRMHEALRRISAASAEIARSCGEGQLDITAAPRALSVRPEDAALIEGGELETNP